MRKYWAFFLGNIQNTLAFRGPLFVWLASGMLALLGSVYVWFSASGGQTFGGFTKNELITYYILVLTIGWIVNWMPFYWLKDEIADGSIVTTTLIKPVSLYLRVFFAEAGWRAVAIWWGMLGTIIFVFVFRDNFVFVSSTGLNIIYLVFSLILSIMVVFSMSMVMTLLAFWFTHVDVFDSFNWVARMLLGGQAIPISFFSGPLRSLVNLLPFRYTISFPLEIYFNKVTSLQIFFGFVVELFWIGIFIALYKIMLARGLKTYTAFGS